MGPSRGALGLQVGLVVELALAFLAAEVLRDVDIVRSTLLSMIGWATFALLWFVWFCEQHGIGGALARIARVAVLTAVAFPLLYAYYAHSGLVAAGIEVDAGYTFLALHWFVGGGNPITYAGRTTSFAQFPFALLTHLPADLVGFDRLGPFAIHAGIMLQIAALLALLIVVLVERNVLVQAVLVALAAAVFSNRLTVLLYNLTGYAIPAVAVGILFLIIALGDRRPSVVFPRAGALLALALLHHYPGFFFVLPIVAAWVVAGRTPWLRVAAFVRANVPLFAVLIIGAICVAIHPELLVQRLRAVTTENAGADAFRLKAAKNWTFLTGGFPPLFIRMFFRESAGSWHLLDIPPLGGPTPWLVVGSWIATVLALGRRGVGYVMRLAVLALGLVALTGLQHVVTGFENYRDMMLVIGLVTTSVAVVPLIARMDARRGGLLAVWSLAVAACNWTDVTALVGRHYDVSEYAPQAQALAERHRLHRRRDDAGLRDAILVAIVPQPFPLAPLYQLAAHRHAIDLRIRDAQQFCDDPVATVDGTLSADCHAVGFALAPSMCRGAIERLGWPAPPDGSTAVMYAFSNACGAPAARTISSARAVPLDD
jgi:hypothetical protein